MPTERLAKEVATGMLFLVVITMSFSIALFEITSSLFMGLAIISYLQAKPKPSFNKTFLILLSLYFLTNALSLTQSHHLFNSLKGLFRVFRSILLCLSVSYVIDSEKKLRGVYQCFLWVAFFLSVDAILQKITGVEWLRGRSMTAYIGETRRWTGPFHHANDFAAYLSFVIFLFLGLLTDGFKIFSRTKFFFFLASGFLTFVCLLGTYSRGAWVSVGIAFTLMALLKKSKRMGYLIVMVVLWGILFPRPPSRLGWCPASILRITPLPKEKNCGASRCG